MAVSTTLPAAPVAVSTTEPATPVAVSTTFPTASVADPTTPLITAVALSVIGSTTLVTSSTAEPAPLVTSSTTEPAAACSTVHDIGGGSNNAADDWSSGVNDLCNSIDNTPKACSATISSSFAVGSFWDCFGVRRRCTDWYGCGRRWKGGLARYNTSYAVNNTTDKSTSACRRSAGLSVTCFYGKISIVQWKNIFRFLPLEDVVGSVVVVSGKVAPPVGLATPAGAVPTGRVAGSVSVSPELPTPTPTLPVPTTGTDTGTDT
ncbi:hypothetical protein EDC01DRAFT_389077 [Geopyxis carbonaria]|nr:hypothetical protein EDC01DRAFT_389077 [Geopyxis carbonaria]